MIRTLIRKQLLELFQSAFVKRSTGAAKTKRDTAVSFGLLAVLFAFLGFSFYTIAKEIGGVILGQGFNWLYFALTGLFSILLGVFGSVFNTYASLYLPKDNEFLLSLPVPPVKLLIARTSGVLLTSLMYSALLWIPSLAAYWHIVPVTAKNIIFPVLLLFVIALFVSVLSCILGFLVALIAVKTKGRSILTVIFSLTVLVLYYIVYFKVINSIREIAAHLDELGSTVRSWMHYLHLLGKAAEGGVIPLLIITAVTAALAAVCLFVLSRTFLRFAFSGSTASKPAKSGNTTDMRKPDTALLFREYRHFTSVSTWMLNGGFGLLVMPVGAVALLIKSKAVRNLIILLDEILPDVAAALPVFALAAAGLLISTNCILAVSVSIEGKSMWILQSLPVEPRDVLRAKERMCIQMSVPPVLFFSVTACLVLRLQTAEILLVTAGSLLFIWAVADFGLFLNLRRPNLNWTNAATLTKQSLPVLINLFGGWGFCAALGAGGFFLCRIVPAYVVLAAYCVILAALCLILHRWLRVTGEQLLRFL